MASLVVFATAACSEPDDPVFDTSALDDVDEVTVLDTELPAASGTDEAVLLDEDQCMSPQQSGSLRSGLPDVDVSAPLPRLGRVASR